MTKCCYILFCLLLHHLAYAQSATEEALNKACNCFDATNFSEITKDRIPAIVDSCIQEGLYTNMTGVLKENQASLDDNESMFLLAQKFQNYLETNCKGFRAFAKRLAQEEVQEVKAKNNSSIGLLFEMNTDQQFPIISIITEKNEQLEFIWFREYDGSTRFMDGIKAYENTIVEIIWKDLELYDAANKKYPFYKEIILIEELETLAAKDRKERIKAFKTHLKAVEKEQKKKKKKG